MKNRCVLVCVTAQQSSKHLVEVGKNLAEKYNSVLEVVSVLPQNPDTDREIKTIEEIHHLTKEYGGEMMLYFNDEPVLTLIAHIGKRKPITVVTGYPGENSNSFVESLRLFCPDQEISMINNDQIYTVCPSAQSKTHS